MESSLKRKRRCAFGRADAQKFHFGLSKFRFVASNPDGVFARWILAPFHLKYSKRLYQSRFVQWIRDEMVRCDFPVKQQRQKILNNRIPIRELVGQLRVEFFTSCKNIRALKQTGNTMELWWNLSRNLLLDFSGECLTIDAELSNSKRNGGPRPSILNRPANW